MNLVKIALLKADYVNADLIPEHGDLPDMFSRYLDTAFPNVSKQMDVYDIRHEALPDAAAYDLLIISGSRFSVNDADPWLSRLFAFIRDVSETGPPLVGFCFGHQALATALGGRVGATPVGWNVGLWPVEITAPAPWMNPARPAFLALFNHREQVLDLPHAAVVHASSPRCPVQMFSYHDRILGMQFHPEYMVGYQEAIMAVPKGLSREIFEDAISRNRDPRTDQHVGHWIAAFHGMAVKPHRFHALAGDRK
ncbi:type 1 glutamine amidotransferase [Sphingobium sp.]|uniref:type 1 glutamine amidotransferase n=1 Tax=Sphingobium sp. TaxID=1912891 RepID=UPI000DB60484|nr:type 1 glutamine amidotransferase [Sphingobium sp.]PZU68651.1 MAG: hypothetical protein DI540_07835 [Sphingobium sp.]